MTALRRTSIGDFQIAEAWGLEEFQEAVHASRLMNPPDETVVRSEREVEAESGGEAESVAGSAGSGGKTEWLPEMLRAAKEFWKQWPGRN